MKLSTMHTVLLAVLMMFAASGADAAKCSLTQAEVAIVEKTLQLTNVERQRKGLPKLRKDPRVQAAAQAHACDMMRKGYFSHRGKDGSSFGKRLHRQGCRAGTGAENIAVGQSSPVEVMRSWMTSKGHRKNILIGMGVDRFGLGLAKNRHGYYWVMVFARDC